MMMAQERRRPAGHALTGYTDLQTTAEAHAAIEKEHNMTAMEALRLESCFST
jgi:SP family general alpha glucoside:H+ symporter-like MFS transporter